MENNILLSSAYLPPISYFSTISGALNILVEKEENYIKQSYRNRCYILSSHGIQMLTVPVLNGSFHKTPIKDIRIDYSKRWQQVHLGAIRSAYGTAPYFEFYFEGIESIISRKPVYLLDLNMELLVLLLDYLKVDKKVAFTYEFKPVSDPLNDFRYNLSPKKPRPVNKPCSYLQVFKNENGFIPQLSIIDAIFNMGPQAINHI